MPYIKSLETNKWPTRLLPKP